MPTRRTNSSRSTRTTGDRSQKTTPRQIVSRVAVSNAKKPSPSTRDGQRTKVYRAEKMAQHLLLGDYWTQQMTELQVLDLIEEALTHHAVVARWGRHYVTVEFPQKGQSGWAVRTHNRIHLPPVTRNPLTVLHEVAHILATAKSEADHGPGFVAIYRYLVALILGEEPGRILDASLHALGVKADDGQIPPVKHGTTMVKGEPVPGLRPGQGAAAAEAVRLAASAGVFGEVGDPLRAAAHMIARRLKALEVSESGKPRKPPARIPDNVTVPVSALLRANSRDDVAEIVLGAVRKSLDPPKRMTAPPVKKGPDGKPVKPKPTPRKSS